MSTKAILGALLLAITVPAAAATVDDDHALRRGTTLVVRPIHQPMPVYRPELQDVGIRGRVVLLATIDAHGRVDTDIRVVDGHPLLAEASRRALERWTFDRELCPGDDAIPVQVTFDFELALWPAATTAMNEDGQVVAHVALVASPRAFHRA